MIYPTDAIDFERVLALSVRHWPKAFLQIFLLILIFVILKAGVLYLPPLNSPWEILIGIALTVITLYLFAVALYKVDARLREHPVSLLTAFKIGLSRILRVWAVSLLLVIVVSGLFFLVRWIALSVFNLEGIKAVLMIVLLGGLPTFLGFIFFYLAIPLIVVENESLWMAFYRSADLTGQHWLHVLALYFIAVCLLVLLLPQTRHAHWLMERHLIEVFDLIALEISLPFFINLTLFILRNFQNKATNIPSPLLKKERGKTNHYSFSVISVERV